MAKRKKYLWMEVDMKNGELPLYVCDSCYQLAKHCGVTTETIRASISRCKDGTRFRRVPLISDEEEMRCEV